MGRKHAACSSAGSMSPLGLKRLTRRTKLDAEGAVRRELFPAEGSEAVRAPAPNSPFSSAAQPRPDLTDGRSCTKQDAQCVEPAAPATPEQQHRSRRQLPQGCCASAASLLASPLLPTLQAWRQRLVQLQPLVRLGDEALLGAAAVMEGFVAARPELGAALAASPQHTAAYLASALWLVAKLCGVRTQIPNRSLVSQATQVNAQALTDFELDLLTSLDWDAVALLRRRGLLC